MSEYLSTPEQWDALAARVRAARIVGIDTEFYGLDVRKQSCVGLARVHVWSVAIRTRRLSPLGFHVASGFVLPGEALAHPSIRAVLEDPGVRKCCHNQPVDDHAIHNHGINLRGCINTLSVARWVWPELVTAGGFGLKNLMWVRLNREPVCTFADVVKWEREVVVDYYKTRVERRCECGVDGCRKRLGHTKHLDEVTTKFQKLKTERGEYPLESIVPGHERWELLVRYAGEDAIAALEIEELARHQEDPAPFPYGGERPAFTRAVDDGVVAMERAGVPIDVNLAASQLAKAKGDERDELAWLRKWWRKNLSDRPRPDEDIDAVWSSPKQLVALFDSLGFPRSPVWKLGRVKRGDVKMDGTAVGWIAKAHPPARQLVGHFLQLKKIRAGKKYLEQAVASGGVIHPVCGPMGDGDSRNGAVTGRLGIKGAMPLQQLPSKEEVDIYQIRRVIVANVGSR